MGRIVGIDLGTTYSAVAIPEERRADGFLVVPGCPGCSVILDANKRRITPSVVAEDNAGKIVVGYPAKGRAGLSPEPIMFSKRWMGEEKSFRLARQGTLKPEHVAAHILGYLKQVAETRLGEKVDEAVITVPAYFALQARQKTEEAAQLAGLKVAQIAQEPVAAALMYCAGDPRSNLRLMTYDLGGGTFDVAILEKRDGVISTSSIRAFDGDRFLGGYNFDERLAWWIVDQVKRDYDLDLNLDRNPSDRERFAKFMVLAERAKIALSQGEDCEIQDPAFNVRDNAGNDVVVQLTLTREVFEGLIRKHIESTIDLCRRALEKCDPPLRAEQIDEVLMVGGSSRIPMVGRRLQEEFGKKPRLIEPDLCVALGAAILAGTRRGQEHGCLRLDPLPAQTDLPKITVTGTIVPGPGLAAVKGANVLLRSADGSYQSKRSPRDDGKFAFPDVPLALEGARTFVLAVQAPGGSEVVSHRFEVKHSASATGSIVEAVTNVLSKPIALKLADGLEIIAPERKPLPYQTVVQAKTTDASGTIRVPILEENNTLGEIVVRNLPRDLPIGTAVEVTVSIHENYRLTGRAFLPSLKREEKVEIPITILGMTTREEQERRHGDLSRRADDALKSAGAGTVFGDPRVRRLKQLLADCKEMLQARNPDLSRIRDQLDEVESIIRQLGVAWKPEPPRAAFDRKCNDAETLLAALVSARPEKEKEGFDKRLAAFKQEADKAEKAQNSAAWKDAFQKVCRLCDEIEEQMPRQPCSGQPAPPPDPGALLMHLAGELRKLADQAKQEGVFERFKAEFKEAAEALQRINPKAPDAMNQIQDWYMTRYTPLRDKLDSPPDPTTEGLVKKA